MALRRIGYNRLSAACWPGGLGGCSATAASLRLSLAWRRSAAAAKYHHAAIGSIMKKWHHRDGGDAHWLAARQA